MVAVLRYFSQQRRRVSIYQLTLLALLMPFTITAWGHTDHQFDNPKLLAYQWADALRYGHTNLIANLLSDDFKTSHNQGKEDYLASLKNRKINFRFEKASFNLEDTKFKISGVLSQDIDGESTGVYTIHLRKEESEWLVSALMLSHKSVPLNLSLHQQLPDHVLTQPITISLRDQQTNKSIFARIRVTDEHGIYWPPRGRQKYIPLGFQEDIGGSVRLGDKTYAYVKPNFVVDLPPGRYEIEVAKGIEYIPINLSFEVGVDEQLPIFIQLKRWSNVATKGWFSGDTHVHFYNAHRALLEMQAEGLNVVNVLATRWGERITDVLQVIGNPSPVSKSKHVVYFNEETRHGFLGHTILHPIKELVYPLTWGGAMEGVPGGFDYPAMAHQADKAHAQGGLVTWAHFPWPSGELAVDVALGKVDSIDIFTWGNAFRKKDSPPAGQDFAVPGPVDYWYKFLNTGFKLPVTAGTDKMWNTQLLGAVRTYAHTGKKDFEYIDWINAIREGRTYVTSGPLLTFTANGQMIGSRMKLSRGDSVSLNAEVSSPYRRYPWEKLEIVQNGKVIASHSNPKKVDTVSLAVDIEIDESAWVAARLYASEDSAPMAISGMNAVPAIAHTSPIYITIPNSKVWSKMDAAFLAEQCQIAIDWAKNSARYHNEKQREEVVDLYARAKKIFELNL